MADNHIELHRIYENGWKPDLSSIKNERIKNLIRALLQIDPIDRPDLFSISLPLSDSACNPLKDAKGNWDVKLCVNGY